MLQIIQKPLQMVRLVRRKLSQAALVNAAINAEPARAAELASAFGRGWDFMPGQLGADGLPMAGQLPRPTSGGSL